MVAHAESRFSTKYETFEQMAQIIDALNPQSGGGLVPTELAPPVSVAGWWPGGCADRVGAVAVDCFARRQ